jgi:malonate transporter MadM subunit
MQEVLIFFEKNGLIVAFFVVFAITVFSNFISQKVFSGKIPGSAIAILLGLFIAFIGGAITNGKNGIADIEFFSGFKILGGPMFRDFAIVSTALGASFGIMVKAGRIGIISLFLGVIISFVVGVSVGYMFGFRDAVSLTTIGAGALTFIVGPITGAALNAGSDVIALSIATGVVKSVMVTVGTPFVAQKIGLNNPNSAMIFGGLMGTTSGVAAGLAATDPKLVPYGALTATFYTGLGCLLCPSILYLIVAAIF